MSRKNISLTESLEEYIFRNSVREPDSFLKLRKETGTLVQANMQISPEEGQFLNILTKISGAKRIIEIGTFTGYSSLCFASALPEDGKILCCDISEEWTNVARKYWKENGLENKIFLKLVCIRNLASVDRLEICTDLGFRFCLWTFFDRFVFFGRR
ncbi:L-isoaspartate O-methyltransferase domain protein [Leptospira interrogans str. UI 12758]|uniref:L-isoaspartate O-methyltransferase domain protein n=1 Tax=Leptospira interrogans str. UI 12758 TaxID=1049938 RepID=A0A0E2D0R8_LEPIR|nr:L-isoaspartate O-methyltransferase domain protein [Leptospira interrogans str. UI 12758]